MIFIDRVIYVDPSYVGYMELGTKTYPYKTLTLALIELFNYLSADVNDYSILVKENTTDYLRTLFIPIMIVNTTNLTIR